MATELDNMTTFITIQKGEIVEKEREIQSLDEEIIFLKEEIREMVITQAGQRARIAGLITDLEDIRDVTNRPRNV